MASNEEINNLMGRMDKYEMEEKFKMEMKMEKEKKNVTSYQSYLKLSLKKEGQNKTLLEKCSRDIHDRFFLKDNILNVQDDGSIITVAFPYHYCPSIDPKVIEKELNDIGMFIHMTHPYCMITGHLIMMKDITCIDSIHYFVVDHNLSVDSNDFKTLLNNDIKRKEKEIERIYNVVKNYENMIKKKIKKY
jgi:hypothetical protein